MRKSAVVLMLVLAASITLAGVAEAPDAGLAETSPLEGTLDNEWLRVYSGGLNRYYWYSDFVGQGFGAKLTPTAYPVKIATARFYFYSTNYNARWRMRIYDDDGLNDTCGTVLVDTVISRHLNGWNTINLSQIVRVDSGSFYLFAYCDTLMTSQPYPKFRFDNYLQPVLINYDSAFASYDSHRFRRNYVGYNIGDLYAESYVTDIIDDVGCTAVLAPTGQVDFGQSVTPACSVYNYGNWTESYLVRMKIGSTYEDTVRVTAHAPNTSQYVTFSSWTADETGSLAVACSTELAGDAVTANDKATGTVYVRYHDVGATVVLAPAGTVDSTDIVTPACSTYNYGNQAESYDVRLKIGAGYDQTVSIAGHAPGTYVHTTFPDWTGEELGTNAISCSTELGVDMDGSNDAAGGSVFVRVLDACAVAVLSPAGEYAPNTEVVPSGTWRNDGNTDVDFEAWVKINDPTDTEVYAQMVSVTGLGAGEELTLDAFAPCTLTVSGDWSVACSTHLGGDARSGNDVVTGSFTVRIPWPSGWSEVAQMPSAPSGKPVKRGAWLWTHSGLELVFGTKGYKTNDFYTYDPMSDAWSILSGMPYTTHPLWLKKPPRKGSKGVGDGNDYIYVTQGNNSLGFWKYTISTDSWSILPDVPAGPNNKKVKGGTDLVYYASETDSTDYVYLLKGYKTEFYRFHVATETWEQLDDAPTGARGKWDKGSFIVMDEDQQHIYAHKAKYHEMYRYDTDSLVWSPALSGMPLVGSTGRRKKSKDGGSGAWVNGQAGFYALKGGNTSEFWWYDVPTDSGGDAWTQKEDVPLMGSTGKNKKVKHGADLTSFAFGSLFALKGNKTLEMWRYVAPPVFGPTRTGRGGAMTAGARPLARMLVSPNPLSGRSATVRYSLPRGGGAVLTVFDVAGRSMARQTFVASRSGSVSFDVRSLSAGVYLVRLDVDDQSATHKLVVQH